MRKRKALYCFLAKYSLTKYLIIKMATDYIHEIVSWFNGAYNFFKGKERCENSGEPKSCQNVIPPPTKRLMTRIDHHQTGTYFDHSDNKILSRKIRSLKKYLAIY